MPLNLSFTHLMVVAIVALVVLGPERLPGAARSAGNLFREWRRLTSGLQEEVREVFSDFTDPFQDALSGIGATDDEDETPAPAVVAPPVGSPLAPSIPTLGPSTGLVSPGPDLHPELPVLAQPPQPDTFVPYTPGADRSL